MKEKVRCDWVKAGNTLSEIYHDTEWGVPVHDDNKLFEFLILEGAQAGLTWDSILKRRSGYANAFANFDPKVVAHYSDEQAATMLLDPGIIRNRLKIASAIKNAQNFLKIQEEFGSFDAYVWRFVDGKPIQNRWNSYKEIPVQTKESVALSKDLIKRGFNFVGPVVMYAYMQAVGLVNDHTVCCFRHNEI